MKSGYDIKGIAEYFDLYRDVLGEIPWTMRKNGIETMEDPRYSKEELYNLERSEDKKLRPEDVENIVKNIRPYANEESIAILDKLLEIKDCDKLYSCDDGSYREVVVKSTLCKGKYALYVACRHKNEETQHSYDGIEAINYGLENMERVFIGLQTYDTVVELDRILREESEYDYGFREEDY